MVLPWPKDSLGSQGALCVGRMHAVGLPVCILGGVWQDDAVILSCGCHPALVLTNAVLAKNGNSNWSPGVEQPTS